MGRALELVVPLDEVPLVKIATLSTLVQPICTDRTVGLVLIVELYLSLQMRWGSSQAHSPIVD